MICADNQIQVLVSIRRFGVPCLLVDMQQESVAAIQPSTILPPLTRVQATAAKERMFRTFMRIPPEASVAVPSGILPATPLTVTQILTVCPREPPCRTPRTIQDLSEHILDLIFDRLDILDRCCFALCSRSLLKQAAHNEHLQYLLTHPPSPDRLRDFFEGRLGGNWLQGRLKYCTDCGRFQSRSSQEWRDISEKYTRERSGRIPGLWKSRREDGWLRYWIERWSDQDVQEPDVGALLLRREDPTTIVCPRCSVVNVDCNAWRLNRSRQPQ